MGLVWALACFRDVAQVAVLVVIRDAARGAIHTSAQVCFRAEARALSQVSVPASSQVFSQAVAQAHHYHCYHRVEPGERVKEQRAQLAA